MVATSTFFAALAASASLVSATRYDNQGGHKDDYRHDGSDYHRDDSDYSDHHHANRVVYASSAYHHSSAIPSKASIIPTASAASYYTPAHIASFAVPTLVSKRSTTPTHTFSTFVDPFATSSKAAGGAFVAPIVLYTPSSAARSKITPAPSQGFSTVIAGNATTARPQTTLSLFNACSGTNSTCATLRDLTYFASVVTADGASTVFAIDCSQRGRNASTQCFSKAMTVTQGPSLFARVDDSAPTPKTVSCNVISRTVSAVCTETHRASVAASAAVPRNSGIATVAGTSFSFQGAQIYYNPLIVTAGAEKLSATRTPVSPSSNSVTAAAASATGNGAGALAAPAASMAGVAAVVFAVLAL